MNLLTELLSRFEKKVLLANKNKDYKHNGDMLDQAEQMAQNDLNETYDELAPGTQQTEMNNKIKGNTNQKCLCT